VDDTPEELARERALIERIRASAEADGFVPFDRFMDRALYADKIGYYTGPAHPLGRSGDFYTAPHVHPLFGRALARRVQQIHDRFVPDGPLRVVELGPGDGTLAATVVEELGREADAAARYSYVLVERSPPLRAASLERAQAAGAGAGISVSTEEGVGSAGPFVGVVIAHEVLDAQPVRRLIYRREGWQELGVRAIGDLLEPAESRPSRPLPPNPPAAPEDGEIWEHAAGSTACLRAISDHLASGVAIVIDYGMDAAELRRAHPTGTLAGIRRHRPVEEPWTHPGRVDLSCFVDFTRVRADAARFGLVELAYSSQAEALGRWGFDELLREALSSAPSAEVQVRTQLAAKSLLFGFDRFRVLELAPAGGVVPPIK
jgi:SAM-dependent MidA family methyltransferase